MRGEHSRALQAVGDGDQALVVRSGHAPSLRRLHLGKLREVTVLVDEPRIGMGEQAASRVQHVGVAAFADLDLRDQLEDGFQVDLGDRDLDRVGPHRDGEGDVGLRPVPEVHGTDVRLPGSRLHEDRGPREVVLAADRVELQAGHSELFLARDVEVADLGDGRDVAQEPQKVQLALLGQGRAQSLAEGQPPAADPGRRGIVGCGLRRLAHLTLDVLHELLDACGGRHGFRALDTDDRALRFLVGEVQLDEARRHQHPADQHQEDDDVLPEQSAPGLAVAHRRNASARSRILRGTVMPSRSAVLRLTARSILSVPSTGTSDGRAPRRSLATRLAA